jgi:acyl-CoA synthetase (NDP forming)
VVPPLTEYTQNELKKFIPLAGASIRNPLDTGLVFRDVSVLAREMDLVTADPSIDMLIIMPHLDMARHTGTEQVQGLIDYLADFSKNNRWNKPMVLVFHSFANEAWEAELRSRLKVELPQKGVPVYSSLISASRALARFTEYHRVQREMAG